MPKAEQVMIDQIFINEEQALLKKARDCINDGESKLDTKQFRVVS